MRINEALPVGTVIKLKEVEKRVVIIGILQQSEENEKIEIYDYIGVPYPEGFLDMDTTVLFQQTAIENIFSVGYSDIERQIFISDMKKQLGEENIGNMEENI